MIFFAELDVMDHVQAGTMGLNAIRLPSETLFSYEMKVNKFMDVPLSVEPGGLAMDADRIMTLTRALDADGEKQKQFMLIMGMKSSALEHSLYEQLFSTTDNPAEGISAVKALKIANDQEIPIYSIDQTNIDTILPQLQLDGGTLQDIKNAVSAGKEVKVSKTDITFNNWTGCGYIIIDPDSGAGAYMISGGTNGAILFFALFFSVIACLFLYLSVFLIPLGLIALPVLSALINLFIANLYMSIYFFYGSEDTGELLRCMYGGGQETTIVSLVSRILRSLGDIINITILFGKIWSLGQCLREMYN